MIRQFGLFCLGFVLGACSTLPAAKPPSTKVSVESLESKTVALVRVDEDFKPRAYCSGVWVGAKTILTARHCLTQDDPEEGTTLVSGASFVTKEDVIAELHEREEPNYRLASVSAVDSEHDLALLVAKDQIPPHEIARVSFDHIRAGEKALTMGHPLGLWWSFSEGNVAAVRMIEDEPVIYVQTTAPTSPGNSGCGLFDEDGGLMGIAHSAAVRGSNLAFYVHAQYVRDLLAKAGAE